MAIIYYENALRILNSTQDNTNVVVPPELLINVGTLRLEIGKINEARDAYEQALEVAKKLIDSSTAGTEEHNKLLAITHTARFNLAYWHET